ncbi:MAG: S-layer homology domain-containing protein [Firmicutes bacterium]|nr:S-layer homology domain-containing protein [Bacillota bacterium]
MKRTIAVLVMLCMIFAMAVPAYAAGDIVWSQNTKLTKFINRYDNVTVKAGVSVTMNPVSGDPQGLEIAKSLTVEAGGTIAGGSIIFERGATSTGLPLYYMAGGKEVLLTVSLAELAALFPQSDFRPTFWYESSTGHYVLHGNQFEGDPFAQPEDGGNGGGGNNSETQQLAEGLKALGLFAGTNNGFELDRVPTRVEEVILLLRLLGNKDEDMKAYSTANMPFTDVPAWAAGYVAYAYDNGLVSGVSENSFGTAVPATAQMFCTFVLRAMGFNDKESLGATDFTYAGAIEFADSNGLLRGDSDIKGFNRGACVRIMESALRQSTKDGKRFWQKLVEDGVFTEEQYKAAM